MYRDLGRKYTVSNDLLIRTGIFKIDGAPVPQVRHSFTYTKRGPRAYYKSKSFISGKKFAADVIRFQQQHNKTNITVPKSVPVVVRVVYVFPRPKRLKKRRSEPGFIVHTVKPDIDNLDKLYLDLLSGVAYCDDNQVTKLESTKVFTSYDHETKSDGWTGVFIQVFRIEIAELMKSLEFPADFNPDDLPW